MTDSIIRLFDYSTISCPAFTLVELLVVVGMIALIMGAMTSSVASAMQRSRIQKATSEVKLLTQAIHSYANYNKGDLPETKGSKGWEEVDFTGSTLKFLNGQKDKYPVLIQAALSSGGVMRDPWGQPYYAKIQKAQVYAPAVPNLETGYYLPNFYRLSVDERK